VRKTEKRDINRKMVKNKLEFRHIPKKNDIKKRRRHIQRDLVRQTDKKEGDTYKET